MLRKISPPKINIEPENDGLVQMIFPFQKGFFRVYSQVPAVHLPFFFPNKPLNLHPFASLPTGPSIVRVVLVSRGRKRSRFWGGRENWFFAE